ncbi:MAG: PDZ domain-containing protein [Chitinophagaceae bacterium]
MKKYFIPLASLALVVLLSNTAIAQEKAPQKEKGKLGDYDEIIIKKKKGDGNGKVTVEIKDGEVIVNGKSLEDYDDDNISVRKRKVQVIEDIVRQGSPFRSRGGAWSFNGDDMLADSKTGFLGIASEKAEGGASVVEVTEKSAAEKAGLKKGDVITKVNDNTITSPDDLTNTISKLKPEDKVTVTYKRNGKEEKATATLGKRPGLNFDNMRIYTQPDITFDQPRFDVNPRIETFPRNFEGFAAGRPRIGLRAQDTEDGKGVKVVDVEDESAASKAGIKEEDVITEFDGKVVNDVDTLAKLAREAKDKNSVQVKLNRNGKPQTVEIKTPRKLKTANL